MPDKHTQNRLLAYSTPLILALILLAFVVGVTLTGDKALARTAAETLVRVTLVVGLWIFVGNSGVISFGHAGYMAIGAYCSAWLTLKPQAKALFLPDLPAWLANAEWHVFPAAIASGLLAAFVALISGAAILRLSGIAAALFLLSFILFASPLIEQIPLAALVGVMFMVVIGTFAWQSFRVLRKVPRVDAVVIVLVTAITVATDLATAVVAGVIVSALAYAWQNAKRIHARIETGEDGAKVYRIEGPLFFGSTDGFTELFTPEADPDRVIVDFAESRVADQSALAAIEALAARYEAQGKVLSLRHLSRDCHRLLNRAGQLMVDSADDPDYGIAVDYGVRTGAFGGAH